MIKGTPFYLLYGLENFSRSILFDEEFESALHFLKKLKAIFSVCDVITKKVYYMKHELNRLRIRIKQNTFFQKR